MENAVRDSIEFTPIMKKAMKPMDSWHVPMSGLKVPTATIATSPPRRAFECARALVGLVERALRFTPGIAVHGLRTALG